MIDNGFSDLSKNNILKGMDALKQRSNTLIELKEAARIYVVEDQIVIPDEMYSQVKIKASLIESFLKDISFVKEWNKTSLMDVAKLVAEQNDMKLGEVAGLIRILLTGSNASPSVFEIMEILGEEVTINRLNKCL